MEYILITPEGIEWNYMWDWLAVHPINEGFEDPSTVLHENQTWQYLGSYRSGERMIHSFRHWLHPRTNRTETVSVNATPNLLESEISRVIKL